MAILFPAPALQGTWQHFAARAREAEAAGDDSAALQLAVQAQQTADSAAAIRECAILTEALADRHVERTDAAESARVRGNAAFAKGDYAAAERCYDEALARTPKNAAVLTNRAACLLKRESFEAALSDCELALRVEPTRIKAAYRGGLAMLALQRPLGCKAMVDAALPRCTSQAEKSAFDELLAQVKTALSSGDAHDSAMREAGNAWNAVAAAAAAELAAPATAPGTAPATAPGTAAAAHSAAADFLVASFGAGPLGIGISNSDGGVVAVTSVDEASCAQAQGVRVGAVVTAVGGQPTAGLEKSQVTALVRAARRPFDMQFHQPDDTTASVAGGGSSGVVAAGSGGGVAGGSSSGAAPVSTVSTGAPEEPSQRVLATGGRDDGGRGARGVRGAVVPAALVASQHPGVAAAARALLTDTCAAEFRENGYTCLDLKACLDGAGSDEASSGSGGGGKVGGKGSGEGVSAEAQLEQLVQQAREFKSAGYCIGGQQNETRWRDDTACWLTAAAAATTLPALSNAITLLACIAHELNQRGGVGQSGDGDVDGSGGGGGGGEADCGIVDVGDVGDDDGGGGAEADAAAADAALAAAAAAGGATTQRIGADGKLRWSSDGGKLLRVPEAAMFAAYEGQGARYKPHRDNARIAPQSPSDLSLLNDRAVTIIIYLNRPSEWGGDGSSGGEAEGKAGGKQPEGASGSMGGQLRLHPKAAQVDDTALFASGWEGGHTEGSTSDRTTDSMAAGGVVADVLPVAGHVAVFRSELLHEVMPTVDGRLRLALSMWCVR